MEIENQEPIPIREETRDLYERILKLGLTEELNPHKKDTTAILIAPGGGGQDSRLEIEWKKYTNHVLIAGTRQDPEYTGSGMLTHLTRHSKTSPDDMFIHNTEKERTDIPDTLAFKINATHTKDQAEWAVAEINSNQKIDHIILSTAEYHLPRFALTFVKMWLDHGDNGRPLRLSILPTHPTEVMGKTETDVSTTVQSELERIQQYQRKGDVATSEEFDLFLSQSNPN